MPLVHYLRQLPAVLRRDHNYSRFLISRTTMQLGAMAAGFYMVFGTETFAISGRGRRPLYRRADRQRGHHESSLGHDR